MHPAGGPRSARMQTSECPHVRTNSTTGDPQWHLCAAQTITRIVPVGRKIGNRRQDVGRPQVTFTFQLICTVHVLHARCSCTQLTTFVSVKSDNNNAEARRMAYVLHRPLVKHNLRQGLSAIHMDWCIRNAHNQ